MSLPDLNVLVNRGDVLPTDPIKLGEEGSWRPAEQEPLLFPERTLSTADFEADFASGALTPPAAAQPKTPLGEPSLSPQPAPLPPTAEQGRPESLSGPETPTVKSAAGSPADGTSGMNAASARNVPGRKAMLIGAVVLSLAGASSGIVARIFLGGGAAPSSSNAGAVAAAEQRQIADLTQQIAELQRRRDELNSAAAPAAQPPAAVDDSPIVK